MDSKTAKENDKRLFKYFNEMDITVELGEMVFEDDILSFLS